MNRNIVAIIVVVGVLILGGSLFALRQNKPSIQTQTDTSEQTSTPASGNNNTAATDQSTPTSAVTIVFTNNGFSPTTYSTKVGQAVTVRNDSSSRLQFSSDDHPTHLKEPELNLNILGPGESASFTPTKTGTWGFHDHINASYTGTLTVTQ